MNRISREQIRRTFRMWLESTNRPGLAAVLAGFLFLVVLRLQLNTHRNDPSRFIRIGETYVMHTAQIPADVWVIPDSLGYDGQFYYQIALNPFSPHWDNHGLGLDNGPYRHQRILYPLIVWLFSFGNHDLIPGMLVLVNYLSLCVLTYIGARYAQVHGHHALLGCLFALYPGFLFTLTHDLTEILSSVFLLAGLLSFERNTSHALTAILFSLAVLTRETTLLTPLALGMALAVGRHSKSWPLVAVPFGVYVFWQIYLWEKWGTLPVLTAGLLLGFPGGGILAFMKSLNLGNPIDRIWMIEMAYLAAIGIAAGFAARATLQHGPHKLVWWLSGAMVLAMTPHVWIADVAFMRASTEFQMFSMILILVSARLRLLVPVAIGTIVTWALVLFTRVNG